MIGRAGKQIAGPFESGRQVGFGDIERLLQEFSGPLQPGSNEGNGDIEHLFGGANGAFVRLADGRRSARPGARRDPGGLSGHVGRGCIGPASGRLGRSIEMNRRRRDSRWVVP